MVSDPDDLTVVDELKAAGPRQFTQHVVYLFGQRIARLPPATAASSARDAATNIAASLEGPTVRDEGGDWRGGRLGIGDASAGWSGERTECLPEHSLTRLSRATRRSADYWLVRVRADLAFSANANLH